MQIIFPKYSYRSYSGTIINVGYNIISPNINCIYIYFLYLLKKIMAYLDYMGGPPSAVMYSTGTTVGKDILRLGISSALVTSNLVDITINSVAITQVPFATNNYQTMLNLATSIQNHADVESATVEGAGTLGGQNVYKILITSTSGTALVFNSYGITAGATQGIIFLENVRGDLKDRPMMLVDSIDLSGNSLIQPVASVSTITVDSSAVLATALTAANARLAASTTKRHTGTTVTWDGTNHNIFLTFCPK